MNEIPPAERGKLGWYSSLMHSIPTFRCGKYVSFGPNAGLARKKDLINQRVTQVAEVLQLAHLLERKTESPLRRSAPARGDWSYAGGRAKRFPAG
ncbi:hypothetical protein LNQ52_07445 [Klebsiella pneumoniae subsp. pneumoniae]|nr:hypothetical protein [Klebsiella pneumoniae subsp. pneumoniae]